MDGKSHDRLRERIEELKKMFPEAVAEGRFDRDALFALLEDEDGDVDASDEKYTFTWKGKLDSLRLAQKRSEATLRPCKSESKNWDGTKNLYIEGDNLEVLKLLQQGYLRKIKMIYIDPPYNTGNDFVYPDDFSDPVRAYKQITGQAFRANPETAGRYHSNWLCMMYPRLKIAKTLLRDDGVIFISIDDNEVHNLRKICDEVFGEENFVAQFPWRKRTAKSDVPFGVSQDYEWIIAYSRRDSFVAGVESMSRRYYETPDFPNRPWRVHDMTTQRSAAERPNSDFDMIDPKNGITYKVDPNAVWRVTKDSFQKFHDDGRIVFPGDYDFLKISKPVLRYFKDDDARKDGEMFGYSSVSTHLPKDIGMTQDGTKDFSELFDSKIFGFPKPTSLIKFLLAIITNIEKDSIILDFFSGSATTAHATMQLNADDGGNRKFIMVQLPEPCEETSEAAKAGYKNICEIGKERVRRAGEKIKQNAPLTTADLDAGFRVFKLDTSNFKHWDSSFTNDENIIFDRMETMLEQVKNGRTHEDVLYEIYIKYGVELTAPLTKFEESGKTFYVIGESPDKNIFACLDKNLTVEIVEAAAEKHPQVMIFARASFDDGGAGADSEIINTAQSLEKREIEFRWA